jgi:hypothetical protein
MRKIMFTASAVSMSATLIACGTPPPNPLMGSGHPPDYVAGWNDGCSSGKNSQNPVVGFYTKNQKQYDSDKQYAEGWNSGYNKCSYQQMQEDAYGGGGRR